MSYVQGQIAHSILNIWEMLDDFIYIIDARQMLDDP